MKFTKRRLNDFHVRGHCKPTLRTFCAALVDASVRARLGRLSLLSVFHSKWFGVALFCGGVGCSTG